MNEVKVTAKQLKNRKKRAKIAKIVLIILIVVFTAAYFILGIIYNGGRFTVTLDPNFSTKSGIILYDNLQEKNKVKRLYADNLDFMDNISIKWLPEDIDSESDGAHNGDNYIAYTFYLENDGPETMHYWVECYIDDVIRNVDEAIRVMIILNGEKTVYAKPNLLTGEAEELIKKFDFNNIIDRYKLGRALYHIAQRRGFKSSKGETIALQEKEDIDLLGNSDIAQEMKKSESKLSEDIVSYMKEKGCNTVGEAFAYLEDEGIRIRNSRYKAIRSQYKEEIEKIFDFQEGLDPKSELFIGLISKQKDKGTIFYQKGLKSQKGLVGKCTLENTKSRCPQSHPEYEKFRALSFLNNIKYKTSVEDDWHNLSLEVRNKLFDDLFLARVKNDFPFSINQ